MKRLRTFWTNLQSTETLLRQLRESKNDNALQALEGLKERLALQEGVLQQLDLAGADLDTGTFARARLRGIDLSGATLLNAYFFEAHLQEARFIGTNLQGANFRAADLRNAQFQDADLQGVNFARADLTGADLTGANLAGANFWQTCVSGVQFQNANFTGASMTDLDADATTRLPDGCAWSTATDWSRYTERITE